MSEEAEKRKEEALKRINDVAAQAIRLEGFGQSIVESARFSRDVVRPMGDLISQLPADSLTFEQWDHQIEPLRAWQAGATEIESSLTEINTFYAQSFAVATTSNTTTLFVTSGTLPPPPAGVAAIFQLHCVLARSPLAETARLSLR